MENSCKDLGEHVTTIDMLLLTKEEKKSLHKQKFCHICKKTFNDNDDNKYYLKVQDHCHYTGKYGQEKLRIQAFFKQ